MRLRLAVTSLARHGTRTALATLGVAVAAAMLLDMVMLSGGMRESFGTLLESRGFSIRLAPRGTLPFDTEATIAGATEIVETLSRHPDIRVVSPVLGGTVHVVAGARSATAFALGVNPAVQGDYRLEAGRDASDDGFVANDDIHACHGRTRRRHARARDGIQPAAALVCRRAPARALRPSAIPLSVARTAGGLDAAARRSSAWVEPSGVTGPRCS